MCIRSYLSYEISYNGFVDWKSQIVDSALVIHLDNDILRIRMVAISIGVNVLKFIMNTLDFFIANIRRYSQLL